MDRAPEPQARVSRCTPRFGEGVNSPHQAHARCCALATWREEPAATRRLSCGIGSLEEVGGEKTQKQT